MREKWNSDSSPVWTLWYFKEQIFDELGKYHEAIDAYSKSIVLNLYDSTNQKNQGR